MERVVQDTARTLAYPPDRGKMYEEIASIQKRGWHGKMHIEAITANRPALAPDGLLRGQSPPLSNPLRTYVRQKDQTRQINYRLFVKLPACSQVYM